MIDLLIQIGVPRSYAGDVWLVLLLLLVVGVFLAVVKKHNVGAFLFATYAASAIVSRSNFDFLTHPTTRLFYFLILITLLFLFFRQFIHIDVEDGKVVSDWIKVVLFSLSVVGLLATVTMSWISEKLLSEAFSSISLSLFRGNLAEFAWMVLPLVILFVIKYRE